MRVENQLEEHGLAAGIVLAATVRAGVHGDPELRAELEQLLELRSKEEGAVPEEVRGAVRRLLRTPAYKPSGRGKPASEYLAGAARKGSFPLIDDLVDANNLASLETGLPCSMLDAAPFQGHLVLRHGTEGESYTFNQAGQEIDLHGLIVACRGGDDRPLGNPVKDSLEGKVGASTSAVVAVVYAPLELDAELGRALEILERCLRRQGASELRVERHG